MASKRADRRREYRFYVQPVQLSLLRERTGYDPEEWKLCGLVRADHFRSTSAEIWSTYWLLLLAALTALLLAIPIVKLHVVHPRERYHGVDGVAAAISSFLLAGLLTFALLDAIYFGYRSDRDTDARLSALARDLNTSFANEVNAASYELDVQVEALRAALQRTTVSDPARRRIRRFDKDTVDCVPTHSYAVPTYCSIHPPRARGDTVLPAHHLERFHRMAALQVDVVAQSNSLRQYQRASVRRRREAGAPPQL